MTPGPTILEMDTDNQIVAGFSMARGIAIASYAEVEQALVELFAVLMRSSPDYAGVSFFRINNSRARNAILERLLKKRHSSKYNLFWNSVQTKLTELDGKRNNIVHWGLLPVIDQHKRIIRMKLTPPNYWDRSSNTPKMDLDALLLFSHECSFVSRSLRLLRHVSSGKKPTRVAWRDICQQAVVYPPPNNHPLSPSAPALQIPHLALRK